MKRVGIVQQEVTIQGKRSVKLVPSVQKDHRLQPLALHRSIVLLPDCLHLMAYATQAITAPMDPQQVRKNHVLLGTTAREDLEFLHRASLEHLIQMYFRMTYLLAGIVLQENSAMVAGSLRTMAIVIKVIIALVVSLYQILRNISAREDTTVKPGPMNQHYVKVVHIRRM